MDGIEYEAARFAVAVRPKEEREKDRSVLASFRNAKNVTRSERHSHTHDRTEVSVSSSDPEISNRLIDIDDV
jgi:hypothetical protein